MKRISAVCPYFRKSLIESIVHNLAGASDLHLWALDDHVPALCRPYVRGRGLCPRLQVFNNLIPYFQNDDGVLFVNDDIDLGERFLERFLPIVEHLKGDIAQPALTLDSDYSHEFNRQEFGSWARLTNFVEVGPVVYMGKAFLRHALPFPVPRVMSWGVDVLWAKISRENRLRMLIVDATPVRHVFRPVAARYSMREAQASMVEFLRHHDLKADPFCVLERYDDPSSPPRPKLEMNSAGRFRFYIGPGGITGQG